MDVIKVRHLFKAGLHSVQSRNKNQALAVQMLEHEVKQVCNSCKATRVTRAG